MFGFLKGLGVTISQLPKKKVTLQYPDVMPDFGTRFRGVHQFIPELCIVCNQCARICPTDCISLSGSRDENKRLVIDTYDINFEICILCDLCVEVCPTEAILMTERFELAEYSRDKFYKSMEWLYDNHKQYGSPIVEAAAEEAGVADDSAKQQSETATVSAGGPKGGDAQ